MDKSFNAYIENSIRDNWELTALSDFKGVSYSYKDIARKIEKMHILMEAAGIKKGDKIAICGRNSSHWAVAFFATLTYGAVVVPILHEFKPDNVHHIVNHSEAKLLFVGDVVYENLDKSKMPNLSGIILINDFSVLLSKSKKLTDARNISTNILETNTPNDSAGKTFLITKTVPRNWLSSIIHRDRPVFPKGSCFLTAACGPT